MALESQGIRISILGYGTNAKTSPSTTYNITSSSITHSLAYDFTTVFTSTQYVIMTTNNTAWRAVKNVSATKVDIHGTFGSTGTATNTITGRWVRAIPGVTGVNVPTGSNTVIDITDFDSTAKERMIGVPDEGQIQIAMNYAATSTNQQALIDYRSSRQQFVMGVEFTDETRGSSSYPTWCYFGAYCKGFNISGRVDDKVVANADLEIAGPVVWCTAESS